MRKWICGSAMALALWTGSAVAEDKTVLVVQSYHVGYQWVDDIDKGIKEALKDSGAKVEFFYMDTKRKNNPDWKKESGELAKKKLEELKPAVVITVDDNAQEFFAKEYAGKAGAPQFVFTGVNAEAAKYGFPAANATGILERGHFAETIDMFLKVKPDAKQVVFMGDPSETMVEAMGQYAKVKTTIPCVDYVRPVTFEEWKAKVKEWEGKADAIVVQNYHTIKKDKDAKESMPSKEVLAWTVANCKIPVLSIMQFGVEEGALCGVVESGVEYGYLPGMMAKAILKDGKTAKDLKIDTAKDGIVMVNLDTAQKLGVKVPYQVIKSAKIVIQPQEATAAAGAK